MTQVTLSVTGGEVIVSKLKEASLAVENLPKKEIKEEMQAAMVEARTYPPEIEGQTYRRTGTYFRSFKLQPVSKGYTLASDAQQKGRHYTPYVGGYADGTGQAHIHTGRWVLLREAVLNAMERIQQRAAEKFRKILESGPGGP